MNECLAIDDSTLFTLPIRYILESCRLLIGSSLFSFSLLSARRVANIHRSDVIIFGIFRQGWLVSAPLLKTYVICMESFLLIHNLFLMIL